MNKISFYLARPSGTQPTVILVRLKIGGGQVRFGTGLSILPKHWDRGKQRVKPAALNAALYNTRLRKIETDLTEVVFTLQNQRIEPTPELVKSRYEALFHRDATRTGKTFLDFFDDWIEQSRNTKTKQTLKLCTTAKNHLSAYSEDRGATLTFDGMDRAFVNNLADYLLQVKQVQNATVWQVLKVWKAFMNWAVKTGLTTNRYHEQVTKKLFNVHVPDVLRLTEQELIRLADFNFSDSPALDNARDLFILQCGLGVRVSDLMKIVANPAAYRDGNNIRITTQKNRKTVMIPLFPFARTILDGDKAPHAISNVKLNKYIKEAAQLAKLNRLITKAEFRGTEREDITLPLHEAITTHCAKKTFVSLMAAKGVSREVIKAITGNTTGTLDRYLHLDENEIEREVSKAADLLAV